MRSPLHARRRQKGAVAIVLGLSLVTLFAMGGVVLDLGHLYIAKSELQNAADAAALAGARRLNETATGIANAMDDAIAIASKNKYNFSTDVVLVSADIEFGPGPNGPWSSFADAQAAPAGKTFVKVNTGPKEMNTYLMRVMTTATANFDTVSTFGLAVAGRFINNVTPIGVCAIKDAAGVSRPKGEVLPNTNELAQFGFRRGVSYNIFDLNPLGGSSNPYLINAVDVYPNPCGASNTNPTITAPFVCNGSSAVITTTPGTVYGNVGVDTGIIQAALNSRFNDYSAPSMCIPAKAPPDSNITNYGCTGGSGPSTCATPAANWMAPSNQTIKAPGMPIPPAAIASAGEYGVLWSYSRAVNAVDDTPDATPGTAFATSDWFKLYPAPGGPPVANNLLAVSPYLAGPALTTGGVPNRRLLNLAIVDCPNIKNSTTCTNAKNLPILGIGRFFMQVPADFNGSSKKLQVEFAGLITPVPISEIRLYR